VPLLLRVPVSGSGHAWVLIDLTLWDPDPDLYRECTDPESKLTKILDKPDPHPVQTASTFLILVPITSVRRKSLIRIWIPNGSALIWFPGFGSRSGFSWR
jgi:hypothetical protein